MGSLCQPSYAEVHDFFTYMYHTHVPCVADSPRGVFSNLVVGTCTMRHARQQRVERAYVRKIFQITKNR